MSDEFKPFQSFLPYFVTVPPANLAVTLEQVKFHLRLDPTDTSQDDYLTTLLIPAAMQCFEAYTRRILITTTFRTVQNYLYTSLELFRSPFQSLTSYKYTVNGSLVDIDASLYYVYLKPEYARILLKDGEQYPTNGDDILQGIEAIFKAGFGDTNADIPTDIKLGLLNHIAALYENRGDCDQASIMKSLPNASRFIYDKHRIIGLVT